MQWPTKIWLISLISSNLRGTNHVSAVWGTGVRVLNSNAVSITVLCVTFLLSASIVIHKSSSLSTAYNTHLCSHKKNIQWDSLFYLWMLKSIDRLYVYVVQQARRPICSISHPKKGFFMLHFLNVVLKVVRTLSKSY